MSDFRVPVKSWLRGPTYRTLDTVAKRRGLPDVGTLLAQLADEAVAPAPAPKTRGYVRVTPELRQRIDELASQQWSTHQIARELGLSQTAVWRRVKGLS